MIAEFGSSDVTLFWLLNTVNRAHPQLAHLLAHPRLHPERLYLFLADLAGGLLTFTLDTQLSDIPEYDHHDPAASLVKLDEMIRVMLDNVVPNQCIVIKLTQTKPSYWQGQLHDARLAEADFYVSVHADMPGASLLELVPRAVKVGSPEARKPESPCGSRPPKSPAWSTRWRSRCKATASAQAKKAGHWPTPRRCCGTSPMAW